MIRLIVGSVGFAIIVVTMLLVSDEWMCPAMGVCLLGCLLLFGAIWYPPSPAELAKQSPRKTAIYQSIAGLLLLGLFSSCCVGVFTSLPSCERKTSVHTAQSSEGAMRVGEVGYTGYALVGATEFDYDRLVKLANADDDLGIRQMVEEGRAFYLDRGTRVRIIDAGFLTHEVRVLSGPHTGKSVIIAVEDVHRQR